MSAAVFPQPFQPGPRLIDGSDLNRVIAADIVSSQDGITAHAGGGQANAFQLVAVVNRVTTVATDGDSVKLPPAIAGSSVVVDNDGANSLAVWPSGTDQLEDVTTAVVQYSGSQFTYICTAAGKWYQGGSGSTADALTATGTTRADAFTLSAAWNNFTSVPSGTGAVLPVSVAGAQVIIFNNDGANALKVYASGTDTIDGTAGATGVNLTHALRCSYYCLVAGKWLSAQLGVVSA